MEEWKEGRMDKWKVGRKKNGEMSILSKERSK